MKVNSVELQVKVLPSSPGVYQYYDKEGNILYIGKAKNLKRRVASYFNKNHDSARLKILVRKIVAIKHIVVNTESDALLLENTLIKKHQPRYNILLKDDKSYPWICIKKERFPRVFYTRRLIKDGSEYFGPYTNGRVLNALLNLIRELYPIRTCNYDLSEVNINKGKYKVCLEYHLKKCKGPCEGFENIEEYQQYITSIRNILKGNYKEAIRFFVKKMNEYAQNMEFEQAQEIKDKIDALSDYQSKSTVVNPKINNVDVFNIESDDSYAYVNYLQIFHGAIVRSHTTEVKKKLAETDAEILELAIVELRERFKSLAKEVYLPFPVSVQDNVKITLPQLGDKRKILDLSLRNAKYTRQERFKQIKIIDPEKHIKRILGQIQKDLRLPKLPIHMECFDNSNIQGTNPVAACVVFKNAKPSKKDYRKFNIKTVEGPNDFASMEEVVYRRYKRMLDEGEELPQLIIVDGGKGQLSSGLKALEDLGIRGKVTIVGIAKRLEEIFYPEDKYPLYLDKKSESLKVIQHMRNEAHRFGITFHRDKRSKAALETELDVIPGIGEKTTVELLKHFRSVKRVKQATKKELIEVIGNSKAQKIVDYYLQKQ